MKVLVACESSGRVRDAFIACGHDALSVDLLPSDAPGPHIQGDVLPWLAEAWDLVVAFPPCTDLSCVGANLWPVKRADGRQQAAAAFFVACYEANAPRVAVENPVGWMNTNYRKPDQIIQPWQFGDPWQKRTCLWLRGLPPLLPTDIVESVGHWVDGGSRTKHKGRAFGDAAYNFRNDDARKKHRSQTFLGIARAMADQWGQE